MKPEIRISNIDGSIIDREMNEIEYAVYLQDIADELAKNQHNLEGLC